MQSIPRLLDKPHTVLLAGPSGPTSEVGYDTNSKDPVMVRSRVFIGRISNVPVTREDLINLFKPFGTVLGLYFQQGFAFVQFSSASEADAAVAGLNGCVKSIDALNDGCGNSIAQ
ncbi:unnamed protein product [Heligmosomoides polygyrus]|uniref:RRM domain-containing protein n=1 Tax=Heligmosomoides polygyrus TaxID=6339 RepID=A0A183FC50_HELPZ|nr:unnamed protein product [Heligmosomoides polygyrus]